MFVLHRRWGMLPECPAPPLTRAPLSTPPSCRQPQEAGDDGEGPAAGFRIGGGGESAKGGLEFVHVLLGLGPPATLDDGSEGVAPHPSGGFAAAARAEHTSEADLFRQLLLSRGGK